MKIRTDFITNSSSSAFVIIGARLINNVTNEMYNLSREKGLRFFVDEWVIGKVLCRLDYDDYGTGVSMSLSSLEPIFREVKDSLAELGINEEVYLIADMFST